MQLVFMNGNCLYRRWCQVNLIIWQYFHTVIVRHNNSFRTLYLGVMKFWPKILCLCFWNLKMCSFFLQMSYTKLLLKVVPMVVYDIDENVNISTSNLQQRRKHGYIIWVIQVFIWLEVVTLERASIIRNFYELFFYQYSLLLWAKRTL